MRRGLGGGGRQLARLGLLRDTKGRHGQDAVLLMGGAGGVGRTANTASLLHLTVVGLWLAPGSHAEGRHLAAASMWDVRNNFLYLTAEAEGTSASTAPYALLEEQPMLAEARRAALAQLAKELGARLRRLTPAPAPAG